MESECNKSEIVSPSLLLQEYKMEYVQLRFAFLGSEWLPRNRVSLETELQALKNIDAMTKLRVKAVKA